MFKAGSGLVFQAFARAEVIYIISELLEGRQVARKKGFRIYWNTNLEILKA